MKRLSLRFRVTGFLGIGLAAVVGMFILLAAQQQNRIISDLYAQFGLELEWALSENVEVLMQNAANDQIQPLFEDMYNRKMVVAASVIDAERTVTRSTASSEVGRPTDDPRWEAFFAAGVDTTLEELVNDEQVSTSYRLFRNEKSCQDCHEGDESTVLGGMKLIRSQAAVRNQMASGTWLLIFLATGGGLVMLGSIFVILGRTVFGPLADVERNLQAAATGDIDQTIRIKSQDEIGRLLGSIQRLISYVKALAEALHRVSAGDLRARIEPQGPKDQLAQSFNSMTNGLAGMVRGISDNAQQLVSAATQIASTSEQFARGAEQQTREVAQISTAIQEMAGSITESSRSASQAANVAKSASETATSGGRMVTDTGAGVQKAAEVARESAQSVARLARSVQQISEIITVIDNVADQTNLLALNAAIEAARAGDQGRGFAVVADEVRKLADRTGKATAEITQMIRAIQSETAQAVGSMETVTSQTEAGRSLSDSAGHRIEEIVSLSQQVMGMIQQVAGAADEQSSAVEEIARSIEQISTVTGETARGASQSAAAAEELNRLADDLQTMVSRFTTSAR